MHVRFQINRMYYGDIKSQPWPLKLYIDTSQWGKTEVPEGPGWWWYKIQLYEDYKANIVCTLT